MDNTRAHAVLELLTERKTAEEIARAHRVHEEEVLAWRALYLAGAESRLGTRSRSRTPWLALAGGLAVGLLGWVGHARSQGNACAPMLPAPLTTFCAQSPAKASEVNGNFHQILAWLEQKIGVASAPGVTTTNVSTTNLTATGTVQAVTSNATTSNATHANATNVNATRVSTSAFTPSYAGWSAHGLGAGGAAIYNDSGSFRTLMIVGNDSGGGTRRVGLWDEVTVNGTLLLRARRTVDGGTFDFTTSERKYIVDASPSRVGHVVALETGTVDALCRDEDGCTVSLAMVNYDGQGIVASRSSRLYISQTSSWFHFDNDARGPDGDGNVHEWGAWDCYLGDAETALDTNNGRRDGGWGLGLLNARGGFADHLTTCRAVFED